MLVKTTREAITALLPIGCRKTKYKMQELADYLDFPVLTLRKIARSLGLTNERTERSRRWISEFAAQRLIILVRAEQQAWNEKHPNRDYHLERAKKRESKPPHSPRYRAGGSEKWAEERVAKTAGAMRKREQYWQRKSAGLGAESQPRKRKPKTYDREIKW
jgi:hypothetical protein